MIPISHCVTGMTQSHEPFKTMQACYPTPEDVCPLTSPAFHSSYGVYDSSAHAQSPTVLGCQSFSPFTVQMHRRAPAAPFQSSWPCEGVRPETSSETFCCTTAQGAFVPDHPLSVTTFSDSCELKTTCIADSGHDACSVPLHGAAIDPPHSADQNPIASQQSQMPSPADICIPQVPFHFRSLDTHPSFAANVNGAQHPPAEPRGLDYASTTVALPSVSPIKRSQSVLAIDALKNLHDSPLDYYAALPLQTFPTPSELLSEFFINGDTELAGHPSEIKVQRSTEPPRKIHHRAVANNLGFEPTDPDSISSHEKKRHYLECLEQYVMYLHEQLQIVGVEPIPLERVPTYQGLNSRSIRTLLVHMQDSVRSLHNTCLEEEQKFLELYNKVTAEKDAIVPQSVTN